MLGAREHYAPVVMAEKAGWLSCFITDLWRPWGKFAAPLASRFGLNSLGRFAGRYTPEIPSHKVRALTGLGMRYKWMLARATTSAEMYSAYEFIGSRFAEVASLHLSDRDDTFFGFTSASLETVRRATEMGLRTVVDQIDPGRTTYETVEAEEKRFRGIVNPLPSPPETYFARIAEEWHIASAILVNSNWSRQALLRQGVPATKVFVAPLAFQSAEPGVVREPGT